MRTRAGLVALTVLALGATASPDARAASTPACADAAERLRSARTLNPVREARRLRRLHRHDPACVEAPEAGFELLEKVWDRMIPEASGPVSKDMAVRKWKTFQRNAAFVQAIVAFERAPSRPRATLALGRMYHAMSTYLDQVGTGPDDVVVIREVPEALYHSRAVDLNEHLKLRAEHAYESVLAMYPDARFRNAVVREARQRLHDLRGRYDERTAEEEARREAAAERGAPAGGEEPADEGAGPPDDEPEPAPER